MVHRILIILSFTWLNCLYAQEMSREDYITKYKDLAIDELNLYAIPASITLAQGILESQNGNSKLAKKSNNHFGIKCHSNWTGKRVYHDDDKSQECFRKYPTVRRLTGIILFFCKGKDMPLCLSSIFWIIKAGLKV